ncbi:unnamed protein product [Citrullus colocynthis]|uniref:Uncharacterized protein n=1 Tax=Citrullus colocynthis TaxID=252529 RepID=A0ABP0YXQ6_9ROSI
MIDVANQFGVPSYVFFTASAGYLCFTSHLQELYDQHNKQSHPFLRRDFQFAVPGFTHPVSGKVIPSSYFTPNSEWIIHEGVRRLRESSGILINTFSELESKIIDSFSSFSQFSPVYAGRF